MSQKLKILETLEFGNKTVSEIAIATELTKDSVRSVINRLKKDGKIIEIFSGKPKIYAIETQSKHNETQSKHNETTIETLNAVELKYILYLLTAKSQSLTIKQYKREITEVVNAW